MAVLKMKMIEIVGRMEELDNVLHLCYNSSSYQAENAIDHVASVKGFAPLHEENPYQIHLQKLIEISEQYGKEIHIPEHYDFDENFENIKRYVSELYDKLGSKIKNNLDLKAKLEAAKLNLKQIEHFITLDINLSEVFSCKFNKVRFGRIPKESYNRLVEYESNPYVVFFPCSNDDSYYWGMYIAPDDNIQEVDLIFSGLYFERLHIPDSTGTPMQAYQRFSAEANDLEEKIGVLTDEINQEWDSDYKKIQDTFAFLSQKSAIFSMRKHVARYSDNFYCVGWMPKNKLREFKKQAEKYSVAIEATDPNTKLTVPPTKLKNNPLFRPFEYFVEMYGLPTYGEVDPTPLVAVSYIILFGIMFADLGQGLVLSIIAWLMWKKKNMPLGKILIPCGFSSAIFGTLFGSVFGYEHALDPFYKTVFNLESKPIEVMESQSIIIILLSAVGIGALLLVIAMLINIYSCIKQGKLGEALFSNNGVAGLIFYLSLISLVAFPVLLKINISGPAFIIFLIVIPMLLIFFREPLSKLVQKEKDWKPDKLGEFFIENFFEMFEFLLSYLSNTLSFMRVGAFVFVHAGMMIVVFALAGPIGTAKHVIVSIIGNIAIIGIEGLLVGIQCVRLEYYELFNRFFEGSGKPFNPIKINTLKQ